MTRLSNFAARVSSVLSKVSGRRWLLIAVIQAIGVKVWLLVSEAIPFNGDEAIVSLMARHILQGEKPVFFYGQAYMGSLDAWLVSGAFWLFGEFVLSVRIVQIGLYVLYLITLWFLMRRLFRDPATANIGAVLAALPPVLMTTYTSATLGGYGEILFLGNIVLILGYDVLFGKRQAAWWAWLFLGLAGGIGFWVLGMMGVYLLGVGIVGLWKFSLRKIPFYGLAASGFFAGSAPWWWYNLTSDWLALKSFFDSGLVETSAWHNFLGFSLLGIPGLLGMRFPWTENYAPWPLLFVIILLSQAVVLYLVRVLRHDEDVAALGAKFYLGIFGFSFCLVFVFSQFGIDATGRYFLPLYVIYFGVGAAFVRFVWCRQRILGILLLLVMLGVNGAQTYRAASHPDKITTQFDPITRFDNSYDKALIDFLSENQELRGYTNYWVSYRLAFLSREKLLFAPRLPYKSDMSYTEADNRYPLYNEIVEASERAAYITSKHPELDDILRQQFAALDVSFQEKQIGEFHIFYRLSRHVSPVELAILNLAPASDKD